MPTTITTESPYLSLQQAARRIPPTKGERPCHTATITRWIVKGVRSADGGTVKLQARRFPGGWKVTAEAIEEFLSRLTNTALNETEPADIPTTTISARRQRELDRVDRDLDEARITANPRRRTRPAAGK
jgi:hypothetical protein